MATERAAGAFRARRRASGRPRRELRPRRRRPKKSHAPARSATSSRARAHSEERGRCFRRQSRGEHEQEQGPSAIRAAESGIARAR